MTRLRLTLVTMIALAVVVAGFGSAPESAIARSEAPSIRVTKKVCENTSFPVFVESHCYEDHSASFNIETPNLQRATTLRSGNTFKPDLDLFAQGDMWRIVDANEGTYAPITVLSCLQYRPGEDLMLGVAPVGNLRGLQRWDVWWTTADTGDGNIYAPSLECIWFELPNLVEAPAVLSLQVFTSNASYMSWTDSEHVGLGEFIRGESGENLEANMVMSNQTTGDVYSFAADDYGQVLVPSGDYWLQNTDTGFEGIVGLHRGTTVLTEIGLGGYGGGVQPQVETATTQEIAQWGVAVKYCTTQSQCGAVVGALVYYESVDGATSGYCVTEEIMGPGGPIGMCSFDFVWGVPVLLTLDTSTLPPGTILMTSNPIEFLVEPNLGGDPSLPVFMLGTL
jgi:hypothetical protein